MSSIKTQVCDSITYSGFVYLGREKDPSGITKYSIEDKETKKRVIFTYSVINGENCLAIEHYSHEKFSEKGDNKFQKLLYKLNEIDGLIAGTLEDLDSPVFSDEELNKVEKALGEEA